jgi:hypothetical protein
MLSVLTVNAQIDQKCNTISAQGNVTSSGSSWNFISPFDTDIHPHPDLFDVNQPLQPLQPLLQSNINFKIKKAKAYIKVDFGDNYPWGDEQYTVDISSLGLTASYGGAFTQNITIPTTSNTLLLDDENPEQTISIDFGAIMAPANLPDAGTLALIYGLSNKMFTISIQPDFSITSVGLLEQDIVDQLRFSICYEVEYGVDAQTTNPLKLPLPQNAIQVNNTKRYNFLWSNWDNVLYPAYEVQVLRLFNRKSHTPTSQEDIEAEIDWSRAMSFILPENTLIKNGSTYSKELTVSEFTGYYAWRIRPIGSYEGGVANNQNWGDWDLRSTNNLQDDTVIDLNQISDLGGTGMTGSVFFFRDPDEFAERNTIYSRVFTEEGKTHEGMNYADGLLKSRQSQSYFPSNPQHKTVITQQYYDHVGRSAISTLPVPTQNQLSGYQERFGREAVTGDLYTVDHFDQLGKEDAPEPLSLKGAGSATDYYSNDGPDPYVDNAEGYPFSISRYSNDGLDNVEQQSGVGKRHMVGDLTNNMGRTTRKNYTSDVSEDELIRIFGMEAPDANTVTKEVTTDPNGTESVSYIDKTGKLLATCLSFNSDLNLGLQNLNTASNVLPVIDIMRAAQLTTEGFVSTKRILFTEENDLKIEYTADGCDGFTLICGQTLYCDFELILFVANIENPNVNLIPIASSTRFVSNLCSLTGPYIVNLPNLPAGDYIIRKVLKAVDNHPNNANSVQTFIANKLAETEAAIYTYNDLIKNILANLDNAADLLKFDDAMLCVDNFAQGNSTLTNLEICLTDINTLALDMDGFDFNRLNNIDLSVVTGCSLNASNEIEIGFDDCGGTSSPLKIDADIVLPNPPCTAISGKYIYQGVLFDLPPFLEYFADVAWEDLTNIVIDKLTASKIAFNSTDPPPSVPISIQPTQAELDAALSLFIGEMFPGYNISASDLSAYINSGISMNSNSFNKMIWHMLNDKYYSGQLVWDDGGTGSNGAGYRKVSSNGTISSSIFDPVADSEVQYSCEQIWNCWDANVESITAILQLETGDDVDPFAAIEDNDAEGGSFGEHFENEIPWLLKLFLGKGNPMDGFEDRIDDISSDDMTFDNLPALFLDCTGYRYARILDPRVVKDASNTPVFGLTTNHESEYNRYLNNINNVPHPHQLDASAPVGSTLPTVQFNTLDMPLWGLVEVGTVIPQVIATDKINTTNSSQISEIEEYFNLRTTTAIDAKAFPYTHNPVFAFKYFEYYHPLPPGSVSETQQNWINFNNTYLLSNGYVPPYTIDAPAHFKTIELEMEYPYYNDLPTSAYPYCIEVTSPITSAHDEWTSGRRAEFLESIINRQGLAIDPRDFDLANTGILPFNNGVLVIAETQDCEDETDAYYTDVNRTSPDLLNNPIANSCQNACESRRNQFKAAIVSALEKRCYVIGGCSDCPGHISSENINTLTDQLVANCNGQCATLVEIGEEGPCTLLDGTVIRACDITYGTPCQKYQMEQIRSWIPEVDFPSACADGTVYPTGHLKLVKDNQVPADTDCDNTLNDFVGQPNKSSNTSEVKEIQNP